MKKLFLLFCLILLAFFVDAQVPVSKEPRHHPVFENKNVRLLNVLLPAGDTTQYHIHSTPSVFIGFTKTNTGSQLKDQQQTEGTSTANSIWFENLKAPNIKIHRVWNRDTSTYHVMDIELLSSDTGFVGQPSQLEHSTLLIDTPWARAYQIQLAKGQQLSLQKHESPIVLVSLSDGEITMTTRQAAKKISLKAGKFFWIKQDEPFGLNNKSANSIELALVEVK